MKTMRSRIKAISQGLKDFWWKLRLRLPRKRSRQLLFLAVILAGLLVGVYLVQQVVRYRSRAVAEPADIFFASAEVTLPPDTNLRLMLDAKTHKIGFTRVEITFDSAKINLTGDIQTTDKLKTVVEKTSQNNANSTGQIVIVLALAPEDKDSPPTGVFEFAQIPIGVVTEDPNQTTNVNFVNEGIQVVSMEAVELDFTSEPASLTLNPEITPTPSVGPTPTPTTIPTETPTTVPPSVIHLYPDLGADPSMSIADIRLGGVFFLPQGQTESARPDWKENMEEIFSQIDTFMEAQFNGGVNVTTVVFPEPIGGDKSAEDYTYTDFPQEVMSKSSSIAEWFNGEPGHRILIIYPEGPVRGANEPLPGFGLSAPSRFVVNPGFWLDDDAIRGTDGHGDPTTYGVIGSAHELGHTLGIPHPWDMPENTEGDPNYGNVSGNIMGYLNSGLQLSQTWFMDIVKERMGLVLPEAKPGDVNNDGVVNIVDIGIIIDVYGTSPPEEERADLNNDGIVNIVDIGIVIDNYGL